MSVQRDPDAILAAWLEDGPVRLPGATKRAIAVTTRTTRQSQRPYWVLWRFPKMNIASRFALGVVAVAVIALGGFYVLNPGGGSVGGPGPTASPAASPTPTPMPFPTDTSGGVPVAPGTYALELPARDGATGAATTLHITFNVSAGWEKNLTPTMLWHADDHRRIGFFAADNLIADPCSTTGNGLEPRLGPTVDDLATGLVRLPGLTSSAATVVSVGGFSGKELDLTAPEGPSPCIESPSLWTPVTGPSGIVPGGRCGTAPAIRRAASPRHRRRGRVAPRRRTDQQPRFLGGCRHRRVAGHRRFDPCRAHRGGAVPFTGFLNSLKHCHGADKASAP